MSLPGSENLPPIKGADKVYADEFVLKQDRNKSFSVPIDTAETYDPTDDIIDDERGEAALLSRIPLLSGSVNKANYLGWRAMGFTIKEACALAQVTVRTLHKWRANDQEFATFERDFLRELQKNLAGDLIRLEFMRNMRLAMARDFQVFYKAACSLDTLTEREMAYLMKIRGLYTPSDLLALDKAVQPDLDDNTFTASVTVHVDGAAVDDVHAKRAAARQILERFRVNVELVNGQLVSPGLTESGSSENDQPEEIHGNIIEEQALVRA